MIFNLGQSATRVETCGVNFDPSPSDRSASAVYLDFAGYAAEMPRHQHRQGQLVLALHGAVTCTTADALWIVPPTCGVWIPGGVAHCNHPTSNARLAYLFVEPEAVAMPGDCCTLAISPMLREMILRLAEAPADYAVDGHVGRVVRVLLDELALMKGSGLRLPNLRSPEDRAGDRIAGRRSGGSPHAAGVGGVCRHERAILQAPHGPRDGTQFRTVALATSPRRRAACPQPERASRACRAPSAMNRPQRSSSCSEKPWGRRRRGMSRDDPSPVAASTAASRARRAVGGVPSASCVAIRSHAVGVQGL